MESKTEKTFTIENIDAIISGKKQEGKQIKLSDYEKELVNYAILDLMRKGKSTYLIYTDIRSRWGISRGCAYKWIKDAYDSIKEAVDATTDDVKTGIIERIESTYEEAKLRNDGLTQVKALELLTKVTGAQAPDKQEIRIETDFKFS